MKILLIGHSIIDHFEELKNGISRPGGILYSAIGMISVSNLNDKIYLLTSWNEKSFHLFEKVYLKTNLRFANKIDKMPEVILKLTGRSERREKYKNLSLQLFINQSIKWNQFDGLLINMITGFDISLEQLQFIRKNYNGLIYFDVHTLSRGVGQNMTREFRPIEQIDLWLSNINILQCNQNELNTIIPTGREKYRIEKIFEYGLKLIIITKGKKGAIVYFKNGNEIKSITAKGEKVEMKNKIGCGDIFGAVFFYSYITTRDINFSLWRANKAGALAASRNDLSINPEIRLND